MNAANTVLLTDDADAKAAAGRRFHAAALAGPLPRATAPAETPARPAAPPLVHPSKLKRRGVGSERGRASLLHAIAHIELNAIDLSADMVARFADDPAVGDARCDFVCDWSRVCDDEARHFAMLQGRLAELGFFYGDFPAHDGLWDAARATRHDIAARLAVAPLVLEARGLDVTPSMIAKFDAVGDGRSADILRTIYSEEISHVETGMRWFRHVAEARNHPAEAYFQDLVRAHFRGQLKPPFNEAARNLAQFPARFYAPLAK